MWFCLPAFRNDCKRTKFRGRLFQQLYMKEIWKQPATIEGLNALNHNTMGEMLGIVFTKIGPDFLAAAMPVTAKNVQPYRILHGGASVALAETLGSVASTLCLGDLNTQTGVGLEINANHLKSVNDFLFLSLHQLYLIMTCFQAIQLNAYKLQAQ